MLSLHRTLSLGYLGQHPTRAALVVASIALGVATFVATQALNRGLGQGAQKAINPFAGLADLLVTNNVESGVPEGLARELLDAKLPGVREAHPVIMARVGLVELKNRSVRLFGLNLPKGKQAGDGAAADNPWGATPKWNWKALVSLPPNPALVGEPLAEELAAAGVATDRLTIRVAGKKPQVAPVGTVRFDPNKLPISGHVLVMELHDASRLVYPKAEGKTVTQINVTLEEGADPEQVRLEVQNHLGSLAQVQTVGASQEMTSELTAGLELGFAIGGAGALVVGLFLVYNVLSVSVAERRHDIGILRSVGATRFQVAGLFVTEAAALGLVGSALGLPLGYALAWVAVKPLGRIISDIMVQMDDVRIDTSPRLMVVALLAGTLVAVLAALVPALQAAGEEPADAVRRVPRRYGPIFQVLHVAASALLVALGFLIVAVRELLPPRAGVFAGIVFLLVGALVSTPLLASLVGRVIQPLFRHLLGLEGRLAADNLVRSPGRTGLVIAALAATGGLMVQTAGFVLSFETAAHDWIEDKVAADLFVTSGSSLIAGAAGLTMDGDLRQQLAALPGVETVLPVRFHPIKYAGRIVQLVALDTQAFQNTEHRPLARNLSRYRKDLREPGNVLVSENFAALNKVKVNETITIQGRGEPHELTVVGTVVDYSWNRGTILVDLAWFRREFDDHEVDIYDLFLKEGADVEGVRRAIEKEWGEKEAVFVASRPEVHREVRGTLRRVYSLAYAQQMVIGLVALLGVVSALFISVLQRQRELGLLRAVGASRAQVLRSVLAEAVLMGAIGAVVGFGIGLMLEWYVLEFLLLDEAGFTFPLRVPWLEAGAVAALSVVLATLAGLWPAYHATRLRIPEAIAYE